MHSNIIPISPGIFSMSVGVKMGTDLFFQPFAYRGIMNAEMISAGWKDSSPLPGGNGSMSADPVKNIAAVVFNNEKVKQ